MKHSGHFLLLALAACFLLPSCTKEDSEPISGRVELDGASTFHDFFVKRDSTGKFIGRLYGEPMDKSDTTHIFVVVDDIEEAVSLFNVWCLQAEPLPTNYGTNDMQFVPTDSNKNPQGVIYFRESQVNDGSIAEVTFAGGLTIQDISKITFIDSGSYVGEWRSPYKLGDAVDHNTLYEKQSNNKWLCIRSARPTQPGYLVYISDNTWYPGVQGGGDLIPRSQAIDVSAILRGDNNWESFVDMFKKKINRNLRSDIAYWIGDRSSGVRLNGIYLKSGFIDWFDLLKLINRHYKPFLQAEPFSPIFYVDMQPAGD